MIAAFTVALAAFALQSSDFRDGATMPHVTIARDCGGENRSPALTWSNVPPKTKSFALIVHDPDAPAAGGFYHWVVYNVPSDARGLPSDTALAADRSGVASTGRTGYYGPCPPSGVHHYVFTLYALDVAAIPADKPLTAIQLQQRIEGHVLARATLTGLVKSQAAP